MKTIRKSNKITRDRVKHPIGIDMRLVLAACRNRGRLLTRGVRTRHAALVAFQIVAVGLWFVCAPIAHGAPGAADETCALCAGDLPVPIVQLSANRLDSMARARADYNAARIVFIDSLLRAGHFGPPDDEESSKKAHLLARLTLVNAYRDFIRLASDPRCVYEATEATLEEFATRYSDVLLFSAVRLERVRMGLGHVCLYYDVSEEGSGEVDHGGKRLRWRVKYSKIDGEKRRVLSIKVPTGDHEVVEVLHTPHHYFSVEYARIDGPPAPYEWFIVYDIEGAWIKKWGTHKPAAYMFWVSPQDGLAGWTDPFVALSSATTGKRLQTAVVGPPGSVGSATFLAYADLRPCPSPVTASTDGALLPLTTDLPEIPLVGIRMYIPGLRFRLPLFLPDVNFDDLRELELAMPVMSVEYLGLRKEPAWLGMDENLTFKDWKGRGDVPPAIRDRFPDH